MQADSPPIRKGAVRMKDVPPQVLGRLARGDCETVNLMEWLAADMPALARNVAKKAPTKRLKAALLEAAEGMTGKKITGRLTAAGAAIASVTEPGTADFEFLASHRSDLVRQWACYAANDAARKASLKQRLVMTLPFATDCNMSVRETAWMAFRPHILPRLGEALKALEPVSASNDHNHRRFAIEVTRPRSVWGAHLNELKREPARAQHLLENVRADTSRYVKLATGNWLNDAAKSRPDWVEDLCSRWSEDDNPHTIFIVKRGLRTIRRIPQAAQERLL